MYSYYYTRVVCKQTLVIWLCKLWIIGSALSFFENVFYTKKYNIFEMLWKQLTEFLFFNDADKKC